MLADILGTRCCHQIVAEFATVKLVLTSISIWCFSRKKSQTESKESMWCAFQLVRVYVANLSPKQDLRPNADRWTPGRGRQGGVHACGRAQDFRVAHTPVVWAQVTSKLMKRCTDKLRVLAL